MARSNPNCQRKKASKFSLKDRPTCEQNLQTDHAMSVLQHTKGQKYANKIMLFLHHVNYKEKTALSKEN